MSIDNKGHEKSRPRWLVPVLVAATILIIVAVGAYFLCGRELFQRPFLAIAVVTARLGALAGITASGATLAGCEGALTKRYPTP